MKKQGYSPISVFPDFVVSSLCMCGMSFWLTDITAEAPETRVLGGCFKLDDYALPVKVVVNRTDVRCPRLIARFPDARLVGCHRYQLSNDQLVVMTLLSACISEVGISLGAGLVNERSEGNVALRPGSSEPITPHTHYVLRSVTQIAGVDAVFQDPKVGADYPLAENKIAVDQMPDDAKPCVTTSALHDLARLFRARLREVMTRRVSEKGAPWSTFQIDELQWFDV